MYFKNMFEFFFSHSPHFPPHMPHATFFLYISPACILKICLSFFLSHSPHFPPPYATRHIFSHLSKSSFLAKAYGLAHSAERFRQRWLRPSTRIGGLYLTGQDVVCDGVAGGAISAYATACTIDWRVALEQAGVFAAAAMCSHPFF